MENEINQAIETPESQLETSAQTDVAAESSPANTNSPTESASQVSQKSQVEKSIPYSRFKEVGSQRDNYATELKKAQEQNQKLMETLQGLAPKPQNNQQTFEQQESARQLAEILLGQPQFKGLIEKLEKLESKTGDFTNREIESALDKEQDILLKQCEEFGLNPTEVFGQTDDEGNIIQKGEIQKYIESHPVLRTLGFQPGIPEMAFKAIYFNRSSELVQKKANLELIKQQQAKKKAQTETTTSSTVKGGRPKERMEEWLSRTIDEAGGIGNE